MDRIAREWARLPNAFAATPRCSLIADPQAANMLRHLDPRLRA